LQAAARGDRGSCCRRWPREVQTCQGLTCVECLNL
jgi:hypothetical protein